MRWAGVTSDVAWAWTDGLGMGWGTCLGSDGGELMGPLDQWAWQGRMAVACMARLAGALSRRPLRELGERRAGGQGGG